MPRRPTHAKPRPSADAPPPGGISLKALAEYLGLSPATVSLVMNRSPVADSIPQATKDRILAAARECNYSPNHIARSLRKQRSLTVGVIVPEVSEGYAAMVMSGIEDFLLQAGYFYFVVSHRHKKDLLDEYSRLLLGRSVDGLIAVDTLCEQKMPIPVVSVSGHREVSGITNVVINHHRAAFLAVNHLAGLGHREVAFIKGQDFSSDTETRWNAIREACRKLKLRISPELTGQLEGESSSPEVGYRVTKQILGRGKAFTALFAFNDIAAIGAIAALREAGLSVPDDVSVVGFDDIQSAAYQNPPLTTVRQPLRKMGEMAAKILLRRIGASPENPYEKLFVLEPELVIRSSSGPCPIRA
ncbi:MAG TPA: LacI family DNA-binding transcriptional regulator [Verrucomicrobiae bacterium]|nr:LacI family DNA-binding transcriptional regulator [Verrucomicrobiae bacterium]